MSLPSPQASLYAASPAQSRIYQRPSGGSGAAGALAHVFRPPKSPGMYSASPTHATATDYFCTPNISRKRHRRDLSCDDNARDATLDQSASWNKAETPGWQHLPTPTDAMYGSRCASAHMSGLVNERYSLAGGFDTPGLQAAAGYEQAVSDFELERRRKARGYEHDGRVLRVETMELNGPLARERNGVARQLSSPDGGAYEATSWTGFALTVAGKLFSFGTSVIKGFYAGGGKGFALDQSPRLETPRLAYSPLDSDATPVPGAWHSDGYFPRYSPDEPIAAPASAQSSPAERPAAKRRHTDKDSWVLVGTPDREASPKRKSSAATRPALRPSVGRTSSGRRSLMPPSTNSRRHSAQNNTSSARCRSPTTAQLSPSDPSSASRRHSYTAHARPASSHGRPSTPTIQLQQTATAAHLSPEVQRYMKRQAKTDRAADTAMNNISRRMEDLIRQAQEALGTKISVEGDGNMELDEGFVDEDW